MYLYLVSQTHDANLPFEQLLTYCPTASGLQISDVSHVLSLILKGPSRSLPLQDLKQVKELAEIVLLHLTVKSRSTKLTLELNKSNKSSFS